jgi:hypothetical protein
LEEEEEEEEEQQQTDQYILTLICFGSSESYDQYQNTIMKI